MLFKNYKKSDIKYIALAYAIEINERVFKHTIDLDFVDFEIIKDKRVFAWCDGYTIELSTCHIKTFQHLFETVAHELIHIWQFQNARKMNHKKKFKKWVVQLRSVYPFIESESEIL